ncbi:hypothetical protein FACS1894105_03300 [Clostridia bacterium]|nr:hypothetical protein FACS1894105_03300 [Clostridia bacterium]
MSSKTAISIHSGRFCINGVITNQGSPAEGCLIGVCRPFTYDFAEWHNAGVNLISVKLIEFKSLEAIIKSADDAGITVLVHLTDNDSERSYSDELALFSALQDYSDWFEQKRFPNVMVSVCDYPIKEYKSQILRGDGLVKTLKMIRRHLGEDIILTAHLPMNLSAKRKEQYMQLVDFIPYGSGKNHNARTMIADTFELRSAADKKRPLPIVVTRGDGFSEITRSYGRSTLAEAICEKASWCFYGGESSYGENFNEFLRETAKLILPG